MARKFIILLAILTGCCYTYAHPKKASESDRAEWVKEMRQIKTQFIINELNLSTEQQEKFTPLYESMNAELDNTIHETRRMEKSIQKKGDGATDLEYEKAAEALYELKGKENAIEMRYFKQFKNILTNKQLFQLKSAENKFTRQLMKQRRSKKKH